MVTKGKKGYSGPTFLGIMVADGSETMIPDTV